MKSDLCICNVYKSRIAIIFFLLSIVMLDKCHINHPTTLHLIRQHILYYKRLT